MFFDSFLKVALQVMQASNIEEEEIRLVEEEELRQQQVTEDRRVRSLSAWID